MDGLLGLLPFPSTHFLLLSTRTLPQEYVTRFFQFLDASKEWAGAMLRISTCLSSRLRPTIYRHRQRMSRCSHRHPWEIRLLAGRILDRRFCSGPVLAMNPAARPILAAEVPDLDILVRLKSEVCARNLAVRILKGFGQSASTAGLPVVLDTRDNYVTARTSVTSLDVRPSCTGGPRGHRSRSRPTCQKLGTNGGVLAPSPTEWTNRIRGMSPA